MIRATFLGTGTSQGVPVIGCSCEVCRSPDRRDQRLRTSLFLNCDGCHLVIDAGPDFRQQMLRIGAERLDGILLTHEHNDHVAGLDDVRPFNFRQEKNMPIFAEQHVLGEITTRFAYAFDQDPYPGAPRFDLFAINPGEPFLINGLEVMPIRVWHGHMPVLGFRLGDLTYITDARTIDSREMEKIMGSRVLVLNALRHEPHYSHLHLEAALEIARVCKVPMTYLTHISHSLGRYADVASQLPVSVALGYDGLSFDV